MEKLNPLVLLIENAENNAYRFEVAISTLAYYEPRLGPDHQGVLLLKSEVVRSKIGSIFESPKMIADAWAKKRAALKFWKRIQTPHSPTEEFIEEWHEEQRMRAFMDVSTVITTRSAEL